MKQHNAFKEELSKIIFRAWEDPDFKKKFLNHPEEVLKEYGISPPEKLKCKVVENTDHMLYIILPQKPHEKLTEKELKATAAAGGEQVLMGVECWM